MGLSNMRRVFQVTGERMAYRINNSGCDPLPKKKKKKVRSLTHTIYENKFLMD